MSLQQLRDFYNKFSSFDGCFVSCKCTNFSFCGQLIAIDPDVGWCLFNYNGKNKIVNYQSISDITPDSKNEVLNENVINQQNYQKEENEDITVINQRKTNIINYLQSCRLSYSINSEGVLKIQDTDVYIEYPYNHNTIRGENEAVMSRLMQCIQ
ncbi:hypothetical protein WA158_002078 [Blastocystis sp. Blastoise]